MVRLSAPILTRHRTPAFTGSIEVDITAEDLPGDDTRQNAEFGKHHINNCAVLDCINQFQSIIVIMLNAIVALNHPFGGHIPPLMVVRNHHFHAVDCFHQNW